MPRKGTHFVPVEDAPTGRLSDRARELVALALCGFSLYALLCLATYRRPAWPGPAAEALAGSAGGMHGEIPVEIPFDGLSNLGGSFGHHLAGGFAFLLGYAGWVPFLALLGYAMALFLHRRVERLVVKTIGAVVFAAMLALLLAHPDPGAGDGYSQLTPYGPGGAFGANLSPRLHAVFGGPGRLLLLGFGALVALLLVTEWMFSTMLERTALAVGALLRRMAGLPAVLAAGTGEGGQLAGVDGELVGELAGGERAGQHPDGGAGGAAGDRQGSARRRRGRAGSEERTVGGEAASGPGGEIAGEALPATAGKDGDGAADGGGTLRGEQAAARPTAPAAAAAAAGTEDDGTAAGPDATPPATAPATAPDRPGVPRPRVRGRVRPRRRRPAQPQLPFDAEYPFPPLELFREPEPDDLGTAAGELEKGGEAIVQKLASFGIETRIVAASIGPAVTQFELRLAEGIRVNRIAGFEADLAAALRALSVRVVAPIPGKDTIGIEVPNPERQKVYMRDLMDQFGRAEDLAIPLFLGKDVAGDPIVEDLARMPHLLIAGTTGSGKSVCINAILLSILMTRTPRQVKLILVDPKMVELQAYRNVPHLCCDVVTNMKKAPSVLQWAVDEMENRYALLSGAGVNHIRSYNRLGQQELEKRVGREVEADRVHLPYIVIVIDEFADLMNVAANEVEESIQRLAQKSRAVGMHVIVATQRPSSEVITGIIKANLPCQIAFKVNRRIDSRVILDSNGAEKLLGHGDMLYVPPGGGSMTRAQGSFVAEEEMHAVVRYLEEQGQRPSFLPALVQRQSSSRQGMAARDDLYREAAEVVLGQQRGSATLLQRALSVGYTRATRLLEMMEEDGLVGPFVGSKSREVLLTLEEWKEREAAVAEELEATEAAEVDAHEDGDPEGGDPDDEVDMGASAASGGSPLDEDQQDQQDQQHEPDQQDELQRELRELHE